MNRITIKDSIPYETLLSQGRERAKEIKDRLVYLILNNIVLYNERLDVHYVVEEVVTRDNSANRYKEIEITIDVLDGDKYNNHELKMSLTELLPTKPNRKCGARKYEPLIK